MLISHTSFLGSPQDRATCTCTVLQDFLVFSAGCGGADGPCGTGGTSPSGVHKAVLPAARRSHLWMLGGLGNALACPSFAPARVVPILLCFPEPRTRVAASVHWHWCSFCRGFISHICCSSSMLVRVASSLAQDFLLRCGLSVQITVERLMGILL